MDCGVAFALLTDHTTSSDNTGRTTLLTLSRWRHGFESRTGCQAPVAGRVCVTVEGTTPAVEPEPELELEPEPEPERVEIDTTTCEP